MTATRHAFVLWAHPVPGSFSAAAHDTACAALREAGYEVDDCDLYAEGFDPVLSRGEREGYHDTDTNTGAVADYVARLRAAECLVLVFPVWNFGYPAILKGFFDRVFLPGVSFRLEDGAVRGNLHNIRRIVAVTSYGATRWRAFLAGDPPRRVIGRALRAVVHPRARVSYYALHDMNRAGEADRRRFLDRVRDGLRRL